MSEQKENSQEEKIDIELLQSIGIDALWLACLCYSLLTQEQKKEASRRVTKMFEARASRLH